jgi:hypothetical protein
MHAYVQWMYLDHCLTMWYNTWQQLHDSWSTFSLEIGWHKPTRQSPIQVLTVPMLLNFCAQNRGNSRCFNIARPLAMQFGLHCMIRQPSGDNHVIWVASPAHPTQTILKSQNLIKDMILIITKQMWSIWTFLFSSKFKFQFYNMPF